MWKAGVLVKVNIQKKERARKGIHFSLFSPTRKELVPAMYLCHLLMTELLGLD